MDNGEDRVEAIRVIKHITAEFSVRILFFLRQSETSLCERATHFVYSVNLGLVWRAVVNLGSHSFSFYKLKNIQSRRVDPKRDKMERSQLAVTRG